MKQLILISALLCCMCSAFAQAAKTDTAKKNPVIQKPQYQPDPGKIYHITLDLTGQQVFGMTSQLDKSLHQNERISAKQATDADNDNLFFAKQITGQANAQQEADFKKWQADTTRLYHPDTLNKQNIKHKNIKH